MKVKVEVYEVKKTGYMEVEVDVSGISNALVDVRTNVMAGALKKGKNETEVTHIMVPSPVGDGEEAEWFRTVFDRMKVKYAGSMQSV